MNNGEAICIQRVGNGWIVCSALGVGADDTVSFSETLVFNDMGFASAAGAEPTLLGFIERHFARPAKSPTAAEVTWLEKI